MSAASERRRVIIDTDGGVDDAASLWWALTDPHIELIGVTTVAGVIPASVAAGSVLRVLAAAGRRDIPVAVGADDRAGPVPSLRPADFIHGADGLGNTHRPLDPAYRVSDESAIDFLQRRCAEEPGNISIVSIGPLTNLAAAIRRRSDWAGTVRELIAMAGSAAAGGNALPAGEANVANDPTAAALVVGAAWRSPPLMVGLDVTHAATLTDREFSLLAEHRTPAAAFLDVPLRFYRRFGSTFTAPECPCHDLLAVMALTDPALLTHAPVLPLAIDTAQGPAWGATIVDFRALAFASLEGATQSRPKDFHPWRIALKVDVARFRSSVRTLFGER